MVLISLFDSKRAALGRQTSIAIPHSSSIMTTVIEPGSLSGLKRAAFIMNCITTGQTKDEITRTMGGDAQLVAMWLSFLQHNHWIIVGPDGWAVTAKGAMWSKKITDETNVAL